VGGRVIQAYVAGLPFSSWGLQARLGVRCEPGGEGAAFERIADRLATLDPQAAGQALAAAWAHAGREITVQLGELPVRISVASAARARVAARVGRDAAGIAAELAGLATSAAVVARAGRAPRGKPAHRPGLRRVKWHAAWIRALVEREVELEESEQHPMVAAALREAAKFKTAICEYATAFLVHDLFPELWELPDPHGLEFDVESFRRRHIQPRLNAIRAILARRADLAEQVRRIRYLRPLLLSPLPSAALPVA
jgi:hypothetical protein